MIFKRVSLVLGLGSFDCEDSIPDSINNAKFVRDLYELSKDTGGMLIICIDFKMLSIYVICVSR